MSLLGTIIGAGASLLGGLFSKKSTQVATDANLTATRETNEANRQMARETNQFNERMIREQNQYNDPANIRTRAEQAGFNPLLFAGPGVGLQSNAASGVMSVDQPGLVTANNYMGSAIADAGLILADGISKNFERTQVQRLQEQNKELQDKLNQQTLRPKVGGIYAQREAVPTLRRAHGVDNAATISVASTAAASGGQSVSGPTDDGAFVGADGVVYPRHFRAGGVDFIGDDDYSSGQVIEDVLGDSMVVEPIMLGSAMDMVSDTYSLQSSANKGKSKYDKKSLFGVTWRHLRPEEKHRPKAKPPTNFNYYTARHAGPLGKFR